MNDHGKEEIYLIETGPIKGCQRIQKGNQVKCSSELQGKMKGMGKALGIRSENNKANFVHKSLVLIISSDVICASLSSA